MTMKHTPGPWRYITGTWVLGGDLQVVARTSWPSDPPRNGEEMRANARLIAAAPDLLHVAEMVLRGAADGALYGFAEAAVRKAKGEP